MFLGWSTYDKLVDAGVTLIPVLLVENSGLMPKAPD
ncbi:hypothetical protein P3T21_007813 [Paraburkholderia sp. GAS334]